MKKYLFIILTLIFISCGYDSIPVVPEGPTKYYLSVRTVERYESYNRSLAYFNFCIQMRSPEDTARVTLPVYDSVTGDIIHQTDANGWLVSDYPFSLDDSVTLHVLHYVTNEVINTLPTFAIKDYLGYFVIDKEELRFNLPSHGFHVWTYPYIQPPSQPSPPFGLRHSHPAVFYQLLEVE